MEYLIVERGGRGAILKMPLATSLLGSFGRPRYGDTWELIN